VSFKLSGFIYLRTAFCHFEILCQLLFALYLCCYIPKMPPRRDHYSLSESSVSQNKRVLRYFVWCIAALQADTEIKLAKLECNFKMLYKTPEWYSGQTICHRSILYDKSFSLLTVAPWWPPTYFGLCHSDSLQFLDAVTDGFGPQIYKTRN